MAKEKECNECKKTPYNKNQIWVMIFGSYLLFSSIYGTIELVKSVISLFK